jgi:putative transposase
MRDAKAFSSKWIHKEFPNMRNFAWQRGYSGFSVSYSNLDEVYRYIENQEDHHRSRSFQEELVSLLKKNELDYDEKYLWS